MTTNKDAVPSDAFEDWASEEGINNFHFNHCWAAWQAALLAEGKAVAAQEPVAYLSTDPRLWGGSRIRPQGTFTIPVYAHSAAPAQSGDALTRELLDTLEAVVKHFTQTPSSLADSQVRGNAHEVIAKAYATIGYAAPTASAGAQETARRGAYVFRDTGPLETGDAL